jgi:hypothetical protein
LVAGGAYRSASSVAQKSAEDASVVSARSLWRLATGLHSALLGAATLEL